MVPKISELVCNGEAIFYLILVWLFILAAQGIFTYSSLMTGRAAASINSGEATVSFNVISNKAPPYVGYGSVSKSEARLYNIRDISSMISSMQPVQVILTKNDKIEFTKDLLKYTIELTNIDTTSVTLKITSIVQFLTLLYGEIKTVDLDNDFEHDISISLIDIVANKATLNITPLRVSSVPIREAPAPVKKKEPLKEQPANISTPIPEQVQQIDNKCVPPNSCESKPEPTIQITNGYWIITALLWMILIAGWFFYIVYNLWYYRQK